MKIITIIFIEAILIFSSLYLKMHYEHILFIEFLVYALKITAILIFYETLIKDNITKLKV